MSGDPVLAKIAEDARGASYSILLPDGQEIVLIRTNKGYWRGGHSHNVDEVSVLLSGSAQYRKRTTDRILGEVEVDFIQEVGGVLKNAPGEPHAALALEDYWLIDMRPGSKADQVKNTNYPPWRKLVDEQLGGKA